MLAMLFDVIFILTLKLLHTYHTRINIHVYVYWSAHGNDGME